MTKYQESLDFLDRLTVTKRKDGGEIHEQQIEILQELVSKQEPKEPIQEAKPYGIVLTCQHCHKPIKYWGRYCCNCGGRIAKED